MDQATCPQCETEVRLKKDGTLWAHKADGEDCPGSGQPTVIDTVEEEWPEEEPVLEAALPEDTTGGHQDEPVLETAPLEDTSGGGQEESANADPAPPDAPSSSPVPGEDGYRYQIRVNAPCPYLDDPVWHMANAGLAAKAARRDGHQANGEARHEGHEYSWDGRTALVTYVVPTGGGRDRA